MTSHTPTLIVNARRRLLPGMIDDPVHVHEPGLEYRADIASETAPAVAGGLTSFMGMPNTSPPILDPAALEEKYLRATGRSRANFGFHMATSTGNMRVDDPEVLDRAFRDAPAPIITHCKDTPVGEPVGQRLEFDR